MLQRIHIENFKRLRFNNQVQSTVWVDLLYKKELASVLFLGVES